MVRNLCVTAVLVLVAVGCAGAAELPGGPNKSGEQVISTGQFKLVTEPERFVLHVSLPERKEQIVIPRDWLVPPKEEKEEEDNYVSSFHYDSQVTSFAIGNGQIGLHLSSYAVNDEGSAAAAAGRDVFLIYDPRKSVALKGLMHLGISKERVRAGGCPTAKAAHFLVGDINGDGLTDLGVVWEELKCGVEDDVSPRPLYTQAPIRWYVFQPGSHPPGRPGWHLARAYSGKFPKHYAELPLIGMTMSPVDYFAFRLWGSYDPSTWHIRVQPGKFMPAYRRKLIEGESTKKAP
jgi:hypothetical protein